MSITTIPDVATIEHLDFDYAPPCEADDCLSDNPPAVVVTRAGVECPCDLDPVDDDATELLCRSCITEYLTDGCVCMGCGTEYPPSAVDIVRWLQ